jgi:hypothetical protein
MSGWQNVDVDHPADNGRPGYRVAYKTLKLMPTQDIEMFHHAEPGADARAEVFEPHRGAGWRPSPTKCASRAVRSGGRRVPRRRSSRRQPDDVREPGFGGGGAEAGVDIEAVGGE